MNENAQVVLDACNGNKAEAARRSGVSPSTFKGWLDQLARNKKIQEITEKIAGIPKSKPRKHAVIPDVQAKPDVRLDHLTWAGKYLAEKQPDVIVIIGDFADMHSLSSYDKGKRSAEGSRYKQDIDSAKRAMELLMEPIEKVPGYHPRKVITMGNHEDRITRHADANPELFGKVSVDDLEYASFGIEVFPFLEPVEIDGISYCHYFYNPNTGRPYAGANLETRLKTIGMSFTMGHQQGLSIAIRDLANGKRQRGLVCGSFYQHSEPYKGPQGNSHWQGIIMKHEVEAGSYDLMEVSMNFLRRRYGSVS